MIEVTPEISIDERELEWEFIRASGPGGQRVNKVASAVQLRFDIVNSSSIPADIKPRLLQLGGKRVTDEGILILKARRYRSQERNRQDALERLIALIRDATKAPKPRRATKPGEESKNRRREEKRRQSAKKHMRKTPSIDD